MNKERVKIVILAAGYGKRMQSELPKVLIPLHGKTLLAHIIESVKQTGLCEKPIVIVGQQRELVMSTIGDGCEYVVQEEQKGTGHAVMITQKALENNTDYVVVLYGDMPFISSQTIKNIVEKHAGSESKITFATTTVPDFNDWRKVFMTFARILRNGKEIIGIREYKDATEEEKELKEVNAGCWVFNEKWVWENLKKIDKNNAQGEYYLTDLIPIAIKNGDKVETVSIEPREALGVNSKEELEILENLNKKI